MNNKVMVRVPQIGRDTLLRTAEVISRSGEILRVKIEGQVGVTEVQASQTLPLNQTYGRPSGAGHQNQQLPMRSFPSSPNALGNTLR